MTNKLILPTISCAALALGGCLDAADADQTSSQADEVAVAQPADVIYFPPTCLTQTADATMRVEQQPDGTYFAHVTSDATTYTSGVCPYYVVDVFVAGTYTVGGPLVENAFTFGGEINDLTPTPASCPNITQTIKIYKKSWNALTRTWSAYSLVENQSRVGTWEPSPDIGYPAYCSLTDRFRFQSSGSILSSDSYRIMFQPLYNGSARAARVDWQWAY